MVIIRRKTLRRPNVSFIAESREKVMQRSWKRLVPFDENPLGVSSSCGRLGLSDRMTREIHDDDDRSSYLSSPDQMWTALELAELRQWEGKTTEVAQWRDKNRMFASVFVSTGKSLH